MGDDVHKLSHYKGQGDYIGEYLIYIQNIIV